MIKRSRKSRPRRHGYYIYLRELLDGRAKTCSNCVLFKPNKHIDSTKMIGRCTFYKIWLIKPYETFEVTSCFKGGFVAKMRRAIEKGKK